MNTLLPKTGDRIIFTIPPRSSYARAGKIYTVRRTGSTVHLQSDSGSGTFDRAWAYKSADWVTLSESAEQYLEDSADQVAAGYITSEYAITQACNISRETQDISKAIEFLAICGARPYD